MTEKLLSDRELAERCRQLEENYQEVRERMCQAARNAGRDPEEITLLAATKTVPAEVVNHAIRLGVTHIGENRVQELCGKFGQLQLDGCHCQFIGHLQTNKVRQLAGKVEMIQSVGSLKLAQEISRVWQARGESVDILIEVNIGREENKSGVLSESLEALVVQIAQLSGVKIQGLMAIPPVTEEVSETKTYFSNMYKKFIDIGAKKLDNVNMNFLSMGMSADYAEAIELGANIVRVGSALFGARAYPGRMGV